VRHDRRAHRGRRGAAVVPRHPGDHRPGIEDGFYYDFYRGQAFTPEDLEKIEKLANEIVAADLPFKRSEVAMDDAIKLFDGKGEKFKVEDRERHRRPKARRP